MTKVFADKAQIRALEAGRDNIAVAEKAMKVITAAAGARRVVLPEMHGGFLPHVLKTSGAEVLPWPTFVELRRASFEERAVARQRTEAAKLERVKFLADGPARRAAAEAKRAARRRKDAEARRAMKGSGGQGGKKKAA